MVLTWNPTMSFLLVLLCVQLVVCSIFTRHDIDFVLRNRRNIESRRRTKNGHTGNGSDPPSKDRSSIFVTRNNTVVVTQIGGMATLPCVVRKLKNGVVSWMRKDDYRLLTVDLTTYSADGRFLVEHVRHLQNYALLIKHVQSTDAGLYECQVSTHPSTSIFITLKVTEAVAEIAGAPDLHLRAGSTLRLVCSLRHSTEPPSYVFWFHERRMVNYDEGVTVLPDQSSSVLLVAETGQRHSGNYTCSPSNAIPAFINVHVLNDTVEEQPAAMQHANAAPSALCGTHYRFELFIIVVVFDLR